MSDRMYRVLVAGGIALISAAPSMAVVACGSSPGPDSDGGSSTADGFPSEGPAADDAMRGDASSGDGAKSNDASDDALGTDDDALGGGREGFPHEGPAW